MKRMLLTKVVTGAMAAALTFAAGCNQDKKKDAVADSAGDTQKYKVLNGSTAESIDTEQKEGDKVTAASSPAFSAQTRFAAGLVAESQGKADCAIVQYDQAIRLDPKHIPSLYRRGVVLTKSKQYDAAVADWKQYIKATGDAASGYSNLGFCYEMAGKVAEAETAYKEGLSRDQNSQPCRINYGLMLARNNRVTEAEVQLSAVLKADEVAYNLASIYEQQGAIAQAKEALKRAIAANPNNTAAQAKLASLPQD